ncbi:hypothetical protein KXX57_006889 [Aspergillus fumigatus]|nr:hypothetical protein KXX42_007342 [Aspergillus fumigatus]KAH1553368.1 hypothetical protein KXX57_006889 [Aspergillus fumigatus]KAH1978219.1 hypothetical protein KXW88_007904 [Aspergillus fumigatus]KAH2665647.1 hypothetical protein KXV32_007173 [Aspergillus fumigatus]KAH2756271.1 hypothetical protein KXV94_009382 [Aspergillus fumigatus]
MPKLLSAPSPQPIRCLLQAPRKSVSLSSLRQYFVSSPVRPLAQPRHGILHDPWPTPTSPTLFSQTHLESSIDGLNGGPQNDHKPPDERILKLGKMKGRTLYRAALWTVPVAWSSLPLVGNVKLQILSERIVRAGTVLDPDGCSESESGDERLVVRWRTEPRREGHKGGSAGAASKSNTALSSSPSSEKLSHTSAKNGVNKGLSVLLGGDAPIFKLSNEEQFTGLFIFSFDEEGRISSHTIEHADDAGGWDRTAKFVTLTDWLIGKARGSLDPPPGLAIQGCQTCSFPSPRTHCGSDRST